MSPGFKAQGDYNPGPYSNEQQDSKAASSRHFPTPYKKLPSEAYCFGSMYYMKSRKITCGFIVRRGRKRAETGPVILV